MFSPPPRCLPFADGRYTVTARLRALGDAPHFQLDDGYMAYVAAKAANHRRARRAYHLQQGLAPPLERAVTAFGARTLARQHPEAFTLDERDALLCLTNRLLGLRLTFDLDARRVTAQARTAPLLPGAASLHTDLDFTALDPIEALALQTQEDWAVVGEDPVAAAALASAVRSKTEAQLAYKALDDWREPLLAYLDSIAADGAQT